MHPSSSTWSHSYCGVAPKSRIIERPLLVNGYAHVAASQVTDRFIPYVTRMNATERSLRNNDKTATNPITFSTQQLTRWTDNAHITCNSWTRGSLYDPTVQYIRQHQNSTQQSIMIMRMFAILDKAKPDIKSIRGLNLKAVKHTTVQVTRLPF
jgi:hypothetical protein